MRLSAEQVRLRTSRSTIILSPLIYTLTKGEPPASLDRFDWTYERGVDAKNARCLSFLLAALCKANVASGMAEVLFVAVDCEVLHTIDEKVVAKALATLEDLNDLGLLDEGEPGILEAARRSLRPAETS